ncbi:hypothetical protein KR093_010544 [Drosophila rubida]|uniref:Probable ATP-dependent RNA helicase DDX52 n=1 Tax=Drosophila rubida TaxID=30044 RepID=A0AAD4K1Z7_9MUSC|nr:hypothetical protein KR093_010544 [Drosophila rubida]
MDTHDIFRQLTAGVRFSKKRPVFNPKKAQIIAKEELPKPAKVAKLVEEDTATKQFRLLADNIGGNNATDKPKRKKAKKQLSPEQLEQQQREEQVLAIRKEHSITVLGKDVPAPITSFNELDAVEYKLLPRLKENILSFGYEQPTPIQMQALPVLLKDRALMACAPTGSGKTLAFLTPIINGLRSHRTTGLRALVLAPTRELAQQIYRACIELTKSTGLRTHIISKASEASQHYGPECKQKYDILVSTPNRVRFLLQQQPPLLDFKGIEWFVLDEADRLMEEGQNNFKEQLDDIYAACTHSQKRVAFFSATYTVPVAKWALRHLKNLVRVTIGVQNSATDTVQQELLFVGSESGKLLAVREMVRQGLQPPVLVFVQSKERAKQLFEELLYDGINVDVIHAERSQHQRDNCVRAFREGHIWVLICTELMGRGIDFKGVNLVINYDFPPTSISYIHRIGRTGRAGRPGRAVTFFTQDDTANLRSIAQIIKNSGGDVPDYMLKMKKVKKSEAKMRAKKPLEREDISTKIKAEKLPLPKEFDKTKKPLQAGSKQLKKKETGKNSVNGKLSKPKAPAKEKLKKAKKAK